MDCLTSQTNNVMSSLPVKNIWMLIDVLEFYTGKNAHLLCHYSQSFSICCIAMSLSYHYSCMYKTFPVTSIASLLIRCVIPSVVIYNQQNQQGVCALQQGSEGQEIRMKLFPHPKKDDVQQGSKNLLPAKCRTATFFWLLEISHH